MGGSDRAAFMATLCWEEFNVRAAAARHRGIKEKGGALLGTALGVPLNNWEIPT
jgi:hypothetical protein